MTLANAMRRSVLAGVLACEVLYATGLPVARTAH